MRKLINKYQFGNSIKDTYSNPYQYSGLDIKFQNKTAIENTNKMIDSVKEANGFAGGDSAKSRLLGIGNQIWDGLGGVSGITNIAGSLFGSGVKQSGLSQGINTAMKAAEAIPVVGQYVKLANILGGVTNMLGIGTDQLTTADKVLGSNLFNWNIGLVNSLGAKRLDTVNSGWDVQNAIAKGGAGYGSTLNDWDEAKELSGKKVGLLSDSSSLNDQIHHANYMENIMEHIINKQDINNSLTAQMGDVWNQRTMLELNGGFGNIYRAKYGIKLDLEKLAKVKQILSTPKVVTTLTEWEEEIPEFKEGGKMNVIPEGSLHARLHHMENAEGLTKKGIPVVSIAEGGELEQQAEIELNEIIFRLEVTQKLEKLMEDGSDNAAIEAGKLLVKEIFENTDDRTGLLNNLKPEEPTPEERVKNHEVFKEGGTLPNLNSIEDLVDLAIQQNPQFVQRIGDDMGYAEFTDEKGKIQRGTHLLGYAEDNGEYLVFPSIQSENGRLQYEKDWKKAFDKAKRAGNIVKFKTKSDAEKFTKEYKKSKQWKNYFDRWEQRFGSYKYGGIIEKLDTLSEDELQELRKYLKIEEA